MESDLPMNALKTKLLDAYRHTPVSHRFYLASIVLYLFGFACHLKTGLPSLTALTGLTSALVLCGFIAWCLPLTRWVHAAWDRPFAKTPIILLHLLALLIATACARFAVAESLGLPPQSFDLTVGFLAALFYLPAWLAVVGILLGLAAVMIMIVAFVTLPFEAVWQQLAVLINPWRSKPMTGPPRQMMIFHGLGALYAGVLLSTGYSYATEDFSATFKTLVTVVALKSDFHQAPNYPGYRSGEYVHPLENGYIAFARSQDDHSTVFGVRSQAADAAEVEIGTLPGPGSFLKSLFQ
ncbi:hypothetical protein Q7C30_000560 [Pseudomonas sp. RAC1]|uniref:hypothetical protein n=1 Tax=Pseudomonas sp. RAC1 TaxID=3064900 RepID=UPI00271AF769|nr:hypothetical protein [Pseudomonas sp. RAC1]MDV9030594.1 hypothetical protein [Pseudomonas sp. RAC1]